MIRTPKFNEIPSQEHIRREMEDSEFTLVNRALEDWADLAQEFKLPGDRYMSKVEDFDGNPFIEYYYDDDDLLHNRVTSILEHYGACADRYKMAFLCARLLGLGKRNDPQEKWDVPIYKLLKKDLGSLHRAVGVHQEGENYLYSIVKEIDNIKRTFRFRSHIKKEAASEDIPLSEHLSEKSIEKVKDKFPDAFVALEQDEKMEELVDRVVIGDASDFSDHEELHFNIHLSEFNTALEKLNFYGASAGDLLDVISQEFHIDSSDVSIVDLIPEEGVDYDSWQTKDNSLVLLFPEGVEVHEDTASDINYRVDDFLLQLFHEGDSLEQGEVIVHNLGEETEKGGFVVRLDFYGS